MNFVFISPNFPLNYYNFVVALKRNGVNVLGIGDTPYNNLCQELKDNLTEYYYVSDLKNYPELVKAMGYFTYRYGKIDYVDSLNEYWLETDAKLRSDFNITTGLKEDEISRFKLKSEMKKYYKKANVITARWHIVNSLQGCLDFIKEVGFPVIVKPNNGVGAFDTYKLDNKSQLEEFFKTKRDVFSDILYSSFNIFSHSNKSILDILLLFFCISYLDNCIAIFFVLIIVLLFSYSEFKYFSINLLYIFFNCSSFMNSFEHSFANISSSSQIKILFSSFFSSF